MSRTPSWLTRHQDDPDPALEARLVEAARGGDRPAFDRLVRAHLGGVHGLLFRMVGNHEDAEDLAQETFVRAWRGLPGFRHDVPLRPWLNRIAVHLARDHFRRRGAGTAVVELEPLVGEDRPRPTHRAGAERDPVERDPRAPSPPQEAAREELVRGLSQAIDRLPPRLRAALVLRVLEERDYEEVAASLDLQPGTVRSQVVKARKLLLRWLAPLLDRTVDE